VGGGGGGFQSLEANTGSLKSLLKKGEWGRRLTIGRGMTISGTKPGVHFQIISVSRALCNLEFAFKPQTFKRAFKNRGIT